MAREDFPYWMYQNPRVAGKQMIGYQYPDTILPPVTPVVPVPLAPVRSGGMTATAPATPAVVGQIPQSIPFLPSPPEAKDYTYVQPEPVTPVDYGKFPMPPMPAYRQMPTMPERQFGMEQRGERQATLRAGLIGLLLGGPAGGVAAVGGAQQGYRSAMQQQYDQALREYQAQAQQAEFQNALEAKRYRDMIEARATGLGEEVSRYNMARQTAVDVANARNAQMELNRALVAARSSADKARVDFLDDVNKEMVKLDPSQQAAYLQYRLGGSDPARIPPGGWKVLTKDQRFTDMLKARKAFTDSLAGMNPKDPSRKAIIENFNNGILADPYLDATQRAALRIDPSSVSAATANVGLRKEGLAIRRDAQRAIAEHRTAMESISRENTTLRARTVAVQEEALRFKKAGKPYQPPAGYVRSVIQGAQGMTKRLAKIRADMVAPEIRTSAEAVAGLKKQEQDLLAQMQKYVSENSSQFDFSGLDTGNLIAIPKLAPGGGNPPTPRGEKPEPAKASVGQTFTFMVDGRPVTVRQK
jgi:hypothetical protein